MYKGFILNHFIKCNQFSEKKMFEDKSHCNCVRLCRIEISNKPYIKLDNLYAFFKSLV